MKPTLNPPSPADAMARAAMKALARHSFCTLATSSARNRPHVAGVLYALAGGKLFIHTFADSRKARNVRDNPRVAVCVPVRRLPMAPPFCVQFQGTAELMAIDDPEIGALVAARSLDRIAGHGALSAPGSCIVRITPSATLSTYGIGVPLRALLRDPLHASRNVRVA
ncbi:MAG TPA: pyridoxamine 5'-phosphate oxidase family protein [Candidatus Binatia bacterium]|nr:pyridoxamine 5'-phosphate oxidase family protein [Candidatus Binatia bacterium]